MRRLIISILFIVFIQSAFATDFFVSTSGNDASGNGTQGSPWRTIRFACTKVAAGQGHTIRISAGTFVETQINVPAGVNILGAGIDQTIIKANSSFYYNPASPGYAPDKFLVNLSSSSLTNGNQSIKNFTIDGDGKKVHGGIMVKFRTNVLIDAVKIQYVNFTGLWLWDVKDSKLSNVQVKDCSWGSSAWASGAINLATLERVEFDHVSVDEGFGYGVKAIGSTGPMHYLKIHDSRFSVAPTGQWKTPTGGSAPNIAFELWNVDMIGCEFYNNYFDNTLSLIMDMPQWATPKGISTVHIYNNLFDMETRSGGSGYGLELTLHDTEVDHNYFQKGSYAIANWDGKVDNKKYNWFIHHNVFYGITSYYPPEILRAQKSGLHNIKFYNNTIETTGPNTVNIVASYGGSSENIDLKNNLIINSNTGYTWYPNKLVYLENATLSNLTVSNNLLFNLAAGTVPGSYTNNLTVDPKITKSGARPASYYLPAAGSPLVDAGVNVGLPFQGKGPDIGAYESTGTTTTVAVTSVTVAPATVTLAVQATSQLTKTISPATATNQNVTWSSSNNSVATVNTTGLVTAIAAGTATITVTTADGGKTSTSIITVTAPVSAAVSGVSVSQTSVTLSPGGAAQLSKTITPANATNQNVTWSSNNTSIATVTTTGLVTALGPGSATITVTTVDGNKTATALVSVGSSQSATLDLDNASQGQGINQFNFGGTGWTHGVTTSDPFYQNTLSYSNVSGNTATVPFSGNKIELYTAKASHHGIVAVSIDNGPETYIDLYSATRQNFVAVYNSILAQGNHTIKIRVTGTKNVASSATYVVIDYLKVYSGVTTVPVTAVNVSPSSVPLSIASTFQLTATVSPANATNKNVTWTSSNSSVATVNSNGLVTGVALGSATITVTTVDGGKTNTTVVTVTVSAPVTGVTVTPATIAVNTGATYQLTANVSPTNAANRNVTWTSGNPAIATVNTNGLVTAVAAGSTTITATTIEGNKTAACALTVNAVQNFVDLDDATIGTGANQFKYTGTAWTNANNTTNSYFNKTCSYSNVSNTYTTLSFNGNKVEFYASKASHHGIAAVSIDNGTEVLVDLYSASPQYYSMMFSSGALSEGNHTIKIRVTGTKNAAAIGTYVIIDYLKVYSSSPIAAQAIVTATQNTAVMSAAGEEAELSGQIQIFPNPVKSGNILHVVLPVGSGVVSVLDVTGYVHFTTQLTSTEVEIPTSQMPTGMYFLEYRSAQGKATLKILVN